MCIQDYRKYLFIKFKRHIIHIQLFLYNANVLWEKYTLNLNTHLCLNRYIFKSSPKSRILRRKHGGEGKPRGRNEMHGKGEASKSEYKNDRHFWNLQRKKCTWVSIFDFCFSLPSPNCKYICKCCQFSLQMYVEFNHFSHDQCSRLDQTTVIQIIAKAF